MTNRVDEECPSHPEAFDHTTPEYAKAFHEKLVAPLIVSSMTPEFRPTGAIMVKCLLCQRPCLIDVVYRCFFCKHYFCEGCAKGHFEIEQSHSSPTEHNERKTT